MAEEFISQDELSLLLETLGKAEKKILKEEKVKPLDLTIFDHIHASRLVGLELIFERWINGLKKSLTSLVVAIPEIFKDKISTVEFKDLISKLPSPCPIGIFNIEPLKGQSLMVIDPKLINITISNIFGGGAKPYEVKGKEFTRIEMKLIDKFLNICYQEFETALSTVINVKITPLGIETNPALLTIARPREKFILMKLKIVIEGSEGYIYLALPEASISPYKDILKGSLDLKLKQMQKDSFNIFQKIPIKMDVILGTSQISFKRLIELKEGDVIVLDRFLREPLEVKIEGKPKFFAFLGQLGNKKAIKIYKHV